MLTTPLLLLIVEKVSFLKFITKIDTHVSNSKSSRALIIGMDTIGQTVTEIMFKYGIDITILDNDSSKIKTLRRSGIKAIFGDALNSETINKIDLKTTNVVIITLLDKAKSVNLAHFIITNYPDIKLIVNAVDPEHFKKLYNCGAQQIILNTQYNSMRTSEKALEALGESTSDINRAVKDFELIYTGDLFRKKKSN